MTGNYWRQVGLGLHGGVRIRRRCRKARTRRSPRPSRARYAPTAAPTLCRTAPASPRAARMRSSACKEVEKPFARLPDGGTRDDRGARAEPRSPRRLRRRPRRPCPPPKNATIVSAPPPPAMPATIVSAPPPPAQTVHETHAKPPGRCRRRPQAGPAAAGRGARSADGRSSKTQCARIAATTSCRTARGVTPGGKDALACLQRNVARLSPGCRSGS